MPTYQRCSKDVDALAAEILTKFASHKPLLDARVKIDFVFAFPNYDDRTGEAKGDALKLHGCRCLGICRKTSTKQRVLGAGDAEISIDGHWWNEATEAEKAALLDHEMHHIEVVQEGNGRFKFDDNSRPIIRMRPHDYEFGWFAIIAARHGSASAEVRQAKAMMEKGGQFFWPELFGKAA